MFKNIFQFPNDPGTSHPLVSQSLLITSSQIAQHFFWDSSVQEPRYLITAQKKFRLFCKTKFQRMSLLKLGNIYSISLPGSHFERDDC